MSFVVCTDGDLILNDVIRTVYLAAGSVLFRLFQNNRVPGVNDVAGDYTEATFDGYGSIPGVSWSVSTIVAGRALTAAAPLVWICTGATTPNQIYGVYATDVATGKLLWAERLPGLPIPMVTAGDMLPYSPTFTLTSEAV